MLQQSTQTKLINQTIIFEQSSLTSITEQSPYDKVFTYKELKKIHETLLQAELFISRQEKLDPNEFLLSVTGKYNNIHNGSIKPSYKHGINITLPSNQNVRDKDNIFKRLTNLIYQTLPKCFSNYTNYISMQENQLKLKKDKMYDTTDFSKTTSTFFSTFSSEASSKQTERIAFPKRKLTNNVSLNDLMQNPNQIQKVLSGQRCSNFKPHNLKFDRQLGHNTGGYHKHVKSNQLDAIHFSTDSKFRKNIHNYNFESRKQNMNNTLQILIKNKNFCNKSTQTISYIYDDIDNKCNSIISVDSQKLLFLLNQLAVILKLQFNYKVDKVDFDKVKYYLTTKNDNQIKAQIIDQLYQLINTKLPTLIDNAQIEQKKYMDELQECEIALKSNGDLLMCTSTPSISPQKSNQLSPKKSSKKKINQVEMNKRLMSPYNKEKELNNENNTISI